jgi:hypothetical protein
MRYIAIVIALVAVLVLSVLSLTGGGAPQTAAPAAVGSSSPLGTVSAQASQGNYSSAIQAAQSAVSEANKDAQQAATANP